jgi:hypothetical protein
VNLERAPRVVDDADSAPRANARGVWRDVASAAALSVAAAARAADGAPSAGAVRGAYVVARGCDTLACEPSWVSFSPSANASVAPIESGVYAVSLHVPPFDRVAENCSHRASSAPVVVRDATDGHLLRVGTMDDI